MVQSRYAVVRSRYGRGTFAVQSMYARRVVEVRSWCSQSTLVRFRYAHRSGSGAVLHFNY